MMRKRSGYFRTAAWASSFESGSHSTGWTSARSTPASSIAAIACSAENGSWRCCGDGAPFSQRWIWPSTISIRVTPEVSLFDRVERPDWAANLVEQFRRVVLRAQGTGIDQDDLARDRLEGGPEMLHRLDADRRVAGRVDAQGGELA